MLVALTGGIGSGKSTVLEIFSKLGSLTTDTDLIVHDIYKKNQEISNALKKRWGSKVFTNKLPDRQAIANIVFNDASELQWLNQLIHPVVRESIKEFKSQDGLKVIAIPLLYETGTESSYDKIISVWCPDGIQYKRLQKRNWSEEEIKSRINSQIHQNEKLSRADYGIINNGSLKQLERQCRDIFNTLQNKEAING